MVLYEIMHCSMDHPSQSLTTLYPHVSDAIAVYLSPCDIVILLIPYTVITTAERPLKHLPLKRAFHTLSFQTTPK